MAKPQAPAAAPATPPAARKLFLHGVQLLKSGQAAAALPMLLDAINQGATHFDAYHALGAALLQGGRLAEATAILQQAVSLRPHAAAAQWDLGAAHDQQGQYEAAIACYARAVALSPKLAEVQLRLAQLYAMTSRMPEAAAAFERAAALKPDTLDALLYRSDAALLREDFAGAAAWARKAVARAPNLAVTHGALGGILYSQGDFTAAAAAFEAALNIDPTTPKSWDGLVRSRKFTSPGSDAETRLRSLLRRPDLTAESRMALHFSLGKVLDDTGDYAGAMENFDAGNRLRARQAPFDRAQFAALVDRAIATYTPAFFANRPAHADDREKPLFIVGMYRSGTTLVERILSSHPEIAAGGELTLWGPAELEVDPATGMIDAAAGAASVAKYLAALDRIGPGAARVTDKLPPNFLRLGAIHASLPRARLIHCARDPLDTCLSLYTTMFASPLGFAARKADLVFYYRHYARLMAHWRAVLPAGVLLDVAYEALIAEPAAQSRRLIAFTGLAWHDACLRPEANPRAIGTSSAWQARQPVYASSVQRWRRYEPWLGELRELLAEDAAGALTG